MFENITLKKGKMLKKLLFAAFLISIFGCLPLYAQEIKERKPAPPKTLARFENEYPMDFFRNAAVKSRLRKLPGKSYDDFMEAIDVQDVMERDGDLLVGKGCSKGLCTIYEAMIVVDLSAKTIHCGIVGTSLKPKYRKFSESPNDFPVVITDWAGKLLEAGK